MAAGIRFIEYANDPSIPSNANPVLAEQVVACGPQPSVSSPLSQKTRFIAITLGTDKVAFASPDNSACHYEVGLDPIATLTAQMRAGSLGNTTIPVADSSRVTVAVGPGTRIGFVTVGV